MLLPLLKLLRGFHQFFLHLRHVVKIQRLGLLVDLGLESLVLVVVFEFLKELLCVHYLRDVRHTEVVRIQKLERLDYMLF